MGQWDLVDNLKNDGAVELEPHKQDTALTGPSRNVPDSGLDKLPFSLVKMRATREERQLLARYFNNISKIILDAREKHAKACIEVELEKALALNRDKLLSYLEDLGISQMQRRQRIALTLEEVTKEWITEISERPMPEFMRNKQLSAVIALWEKNIDRIMAG